MNNAHLVICIENSDYPAYLRSERSTKQWKTSKPRNTDSSVIDESGEDYLYPKECFVDANLPKDIHAAVVKAA